MYRTRVLTAVTTFMVLMTAAPAYAATPTAPTPPPQDNGKWVGLIAFLIFVAVAGGMLFIANAYRKNNNR
jgi:hypothetical protein